MKLYNIASTEKFLDTIRACEGNVYSISPDGKRQDLKSYAELMASFGWMGQQQSRLVEIEIVVERPADSQRLMRYMACAAHV